MEIKIAVRFTSYVLGHLLSKRQKETHAGKDVEKKKAFYTFCGKVYWFSHYRTAGMKDEDVYRPTVQQGHYRY